MSLAYLHIPLREFYNYTPVEIDYAFKAYFEQRDADTHLSWEQTRTIIFYNYLLTPSKKTKMGYDQFKRTILPFSFDKDSETKAPEVNDDTFNLMYKFFNKGPISN